MHFYKTSSCPSDVFARSFRPSLILIPALLIYPSSLSTLDLDSGSGFFCRENHPDIPMTFSFLALSIYGVLFASVLALPIQHELVTRADISPIMNGQNFPDPGFIRTSKGWYAFSTNALVNGKRVYMQKAFTSDWKNWQFTPGDDALPTLPSWVDSGNARVVSF